MSLFLVAGVAHLDVLKIEEPVVAAAPGDVRVPPAGAATPARPCGVDGGAAAVNGEASSPRRRGVLTRDVAVGCTVITRDVGVMPPPPRLRTVGVGTDQPSPPPSGRLSLSGMWTEDIPEVPPRTAARGVQTTPQATPPAAASTRGCQTDAEPLPPPPPRKETRDTGVQVQPTPVQRTHAGVTARPLTADAAILCATKTRDAASSDCTIDDVLCTKCSVRKRSIGVETERSTALKEDADAKRVCLSALGAVDTPPVEPAPAPAKPRTRTVGCGTAGERINPFSVNRAVNTDPPVVPAAIHRAVNTDPIPAPVKPTTVSRATLADVRAPTSSRSTNTDARAATACRATNTDGVPRRDAGTATTRRQLVDAGVTCSLPTTPPPSVAPAPRPAEKPVHGDDLRAGTPSPALHPQSRIPRPSPTTPQTSPGPPPRRQFKRQDTYTKEPAPSPAPFPVVDITNKSPPPRKAALAEAEAASR